MPMFLTKHAYLGCQISNFKIMQPTFCLFVQCAVKDSGQSGEPLFTIFCVKGNSLTAYICDKCCGRSVILPRKLKSFMKKFYNKFIFIRPVHVQIVPLQVQARGTQFMKCITHCAYVQYNICFAIFSVIFYMCNFFYRILNHSLAFVKGPHPFHITETDGNSLT